MRQTTLKMTHVWDICRLLSLFYQKNCFQGVGEGRGQLLWLLAGGSITKKRKLHVQVQSRCSAVQSSTNPPLPFFSVQ